MAGELPGSSAQKELTTIWNLYMIQIPYTHFFVRKQKEETRLAMNDYFDIHLPDDQIRAISSIGLAHLGDAVYELLVRSWLCAHGRATGKGLHRAAVELVRAPSQARRAERIMPLLTAAELAVYKRGRNAHVHTIPHNASRCDYLKATALECLLGDLYLRGERGRINELFAVMMEEKNDAT